MPAAGGRSRRCPGRDRRRSCRRGRAASAAAGVRRQGRTAMRLLHCRNAARRQGAARRDAAPDARGDRARFDRQSVPLHRVRQDHRRGRGGGRGSDIMSGAERLSVLGRRLPKINSVSTVTGQGQYTVDMAVPGMLYARVLRSPHAHARIVGLDVSRARALPGVVAVITAEDVRANVLGSSVKHRPLLASGVVRTFGEPVAAVAAVDETVAAEAIALIEVDYAPLPAVFDMKAATAPGAPLLHPDKG